MSKQALYDAFIAGHVWTCAHDGEGLEAAPRGFAEWYANAVATGSRIQPPRAYAEIEDADREAVSAIERQVIGSNHAAWDRQLDIAAEGQRAAIYHGGLAKRRKSTLDT